MAKAPKSRMSPKRWDFVREYLVDLCATKAARRAGYSEKSAQRISAHLMRDPEIQKAIAAEMEKRAERTEITADMVLRELAKIGFANMADYMRITPDGDPALNFADITREQAAALSEVTVEDFTDGRGENARDVRRIKFKLADKRAALVDIGKHLGMFRDKRDDDDAAPQPVTVIINGVDMSRPASAGEPPAS